MIERPLDKSGLTRLMALFPVTTILGPRQSGKSTLAQEFAADHVFDLENPRDMALLAQPQLALEHGTRSDNHLAGPSIERLQFGVCSNNRTYRSKEETDDETIRWD